ncbi:40S ribosomal protein S3-like [Phyllostomus discolor]|uniref:40S ribosomal protein S3 n=1 Tax=Phyllostomus discolor TaxID=89673 RepID=A0A7E6DGE3_9CHIR|nr:40S ribosomal protein S3-like [Phyllostomus discolor]
MFLVRRADGAQELTAVVQKRFGFLRASEGFSVSQTPRRPCCMEGLLWHAECCGMESGAKGYEVVVSRKLCGQRAKSMEFVDGLMTHSEDPINCPVDTAVHHVLLRWGVLGITVKIVLPWDPSGKMGPKKPLPDHVSTVEPKDGVLPTTPISEHKGGKPEPPAMPQPVPTA